MSDEPVEVAVLNGAAPFGGSCVSRLVRDGMVGLEDTNEGSGLAQDAAKRTKPDDVVRKPNGSQLWSKLDTTANATPLL